MKEVCAHYSCVTRGWEGGKVAPALFQRLEKSVSILEKNVLVVIAYELNFSFKMQFLRVFRRFFLVGPFFFRVVHDCL